MRGNAASKRPIDRWLGDSDGRHVRGVRDYNIKAERPGRGTSEPEPIIIHYESVDPIHNHPDGAGYFRCRLSSNSFNDFGGGLAQGMFASQTLPDGRVVSNIRNILTFPGLGFGAPPF